MAVTTINLTDVVSALVTKTNTISSDLGDIDILVDGDSSVINALNRIDNNLDVLDSNVGDVDAVRSLFGSGGNSLSDAVITSRGLISNLDSDVTDISTGLTNEARNALSVQNNGTGFGDLTYDSASGVFTFNRVTSANIRNQSSVTVSGTGYGNLSYSASTGVFTFTKVSDSDIRERITVTDTGGDGSLTYNNTTGVLTYTGPSAAEVRAHLSAGEGIDFVSGVISGEDATTTNKGIASFSSTNFDVTSGAVSVKTDGITATHIAAGAVGSSEIASGAVGNDELATDAVTKVKIANDAVSSAELENVVSLIIYNSAGSAVKTIFGAGS